MSKKGKPEPTKRTTPTGSKSKSDPKPGLEAIDLSNEKTYWKKIFWILIPAMLVFTWIVGWNVAFHSDEMMNNQYEKENFKYYETLGKDTGCLNFILEDGQHVPGHLRTYGALFDLFAVGTNEILGIADKGYEYNTRHLWVQLCGILAVLFGGLIAKELSGSYRLAIVTSLIIFLTPTFFGHSLLNAKDIPFAMGYTLGMYGMILLLKDLKNVSWKNAMIFAAGVAFAIGTRVGGVLLLCYLPLFTAAIIFINKPYRSDIPGVLKAIAPKFIVGSLVGYAIAVVTWPFALMSPIKNVLYSLRYVSKFHENIPLNFEGAFTDCNHLPTYYVVKWLSMTVPGLFMVLFFLSLVFLFLLRKHQNFIFYLMLLFAVVFPLAYAWEVHSIVYSGWRHFLFIYPSAAVLMALPVLYIQQAITKPAYKATFMIALLVALIHPISWEIRNHPYEYIYFNELSGGFKNNYYDYETETWEMSVKESLDWLYQHENILNSKDTVTIATNAKSEAFYLIRRKYHDQKTKVVQAGYKGFHAVQWDYCVLHILFHPPYILKNCYPPYSTIHTSDIDGMPVCAVMKAKDGRPDYEGIKAIQQNNLPLADSLLSLYYTKDNKSESSLENLMMVKVQVKKFKETLDIYRQLCTINPNNGPCNYYAGIAYANLGDWAHAKMAMTTAIENGLQTKQVLSNMALICQQSGDSRGANYYRQAAAKAPQ